MFARICLITYHIEVKLYMVLKDLDHHVSLDCMTMYVLYMHVLS